MCSCPTGPVDLCRVAQTLVIPPDLANLGGDSRRASGREVDPQRQCPHPDAARVGRDPVARTPSRATPRRRYVPRFHAAQLRVPSCALALPRGARRGFATYFDPGKHLDHWVVEYWHATEARWVRVDSEMLGFPFARNPEDLEPGEFLTGGEAWQLCRTTDVDPASFGVQGAPDAWGIAEIRGNAIRDLAALNKIEMLPWDEWGRMEASYRGETGPEYDAVDRRGRRRPARRTTRLPFARPDGRDDLAVPAAMIV